MTGPDTYTRALHALSVLGDMLGEMEAHSANREGPITGLMIFGPQLDAIHAYVLAHRDTEMNAGARRGPSPLRVVDEVTAFLNGRGVATHDNNGT